MAATVAITEHDVVYAGGDKKIHYLAAGPAHGPLVLFLHGWPGTAITWKPQLEALAGLGFRAVAPDMPGYGQSTARRVADDYCQERIVEGMMALLADTGREAAVWVGHDWGAGVTSSVATQHPGAVKALVNIAVPFATVERGWPAFLPLVDRALYPAAEYPYGQWDYMRHYEESFEDAVAWFEQDVEGLLKAALQPSPGAPASRFAEATATVRRDGGWFHAARPPPPEATGPPVLAPDVYASFIADMRKTGFWPGSCYYLHSERNAAYHAAAPGRLLTQPVLFIHAAWDPICDTKTSRLPEPMRAACRNLTEVTVEAGHFAQYEKPGEVNAALIRFLVEELPSEWPGYWDKGYTKRKTPA
ncbi:putative epoxide hydrolase [Xylaria palmicola]|nr:putative epoxide hydrolase [Xylaria palmicola]